MLLLIGGATARRYQYTGQGLRVRKWTSSNTSGNTYFVYNENAQLIGEYDNAGARVQEIIWLGNLPVGVIAGTAATPVLHYIESDHLGTPQVIVEATRNVGLWRWNQTNDPFGESTPNQNPDGDATSFTFNLRFAGQYRDSESGWYYNVHRYYDPSIGRYLESDPIGLGGGISTYGYVGAAPLTATDPLGLLEVRAHINHGGGYGEHWRYSFEFHSISERAVDEGLLRWLTRKAPRARRAVGALFDGLESLGRPVPAGAKDPNADPLECGLLDAKLEEIFSRRRYRMSDQLSEADALDLLREFQSVDGYDDLYDQPADLLRDAREQGRSHWQNRLQPFWE
jgi:RHS repeat-associated protein